MSLFSELRASRVVDVKPTSSVNESVDENKAEEASQEDEVSEEVVMIATCPECGHQHLSAVSEGEEEDTCPECGAEAITEAYKKVVRDGEVVKRKVRTKKVVLTPAQKQALAKARKKAHTASANKARKKSLKIRARKGLNDSDNLECPECGFSGDISEFDCEDGVMYCPECGAEI